MASWFAPGGPSLTSCPNVVLDEMTKRLGKKMWQVNGIMLLNIFIMGVMVSIGVCAPRYRRHPIIGFIFQGANTLFLPIVSTVATTAMTDTDSLRSSRIYDVYAEWSAVNDKGTHNFLIVLWTGLVIFVGVSTYSVVASDPREGRSIGPSTELLVKTIWAAYLMGGVLLATGSNTLIPLHMRRDDDLGSVMGIISIILIAITLLKIYQKYRVFIVAKGSFILGLNPRLIVSYMARLEGHVASPPRLIVMEGGPITLEEQNRGYSFKQETPGPEHQQSGCKFFLIKYLLCTFLQKRSDHKLVETEKGSELVTLDKVWSSNDRYFLSSTPQAKDLCFSFALVKLLRCRFAKYTVSEAGFMKARDFFWNTYLQGHEYKRVFRVIEDELSFLYDYYYSSLSIPFLHRQFRLVRVLNQVLSIGLCSYIFVFVTTSRNRLALPGSGQVWWLARCPVRKGSDAFVVVGYRYFDVVPVYFVLAAILVYELREIVSYLCCNFTKVVLVCNYVSNPRSGKFVSVVFKYLRCEWLNNWNNTMSQYKLVGLPNQRKIKVPDEVKQSIFKALQDLNPIHQGRQALKHIPFPRPPIPNPATCGGKGAADTILAWHIATSIFEVRQPQPADPLLGSKTAAVRLSQYCAYLVCYRPELLPDNVEWCKTLHETVEEQAAWALATKPAPGEDEFQHLVNSLSAESNHEVLKNGARFAQDLDLETGWGSLAKFWSELILYIAPSEKLDEHAEAISRGGELVTLLWALLAHAGIVERLDADAAAATTSDAAHILV